MVINIWANSQPEGKPAGSTADGRDWSSHNRPEDLSFARMFESTVSSPFFLFLKTWFHSFVVRIWKLVNGGWSMILLLLAAHPARKPTNLSADRSLILFIFSQELSEIRLLKSQHMFFRFIVKSKCDSIPNKRDGISNRHIWSNCCRLALKTPRRCQK